MPFDPKTAVAQDTGRFDPSTAVVQQTIGAEGLGQAVKDVAGDFNPLTQMAVGAKSLWDLAALKLKQGVMGKDSLSPEEQNTIVANRALLQASNPALAGAVTTGIGLSGLAMPAANFAATRIAPILPSAIRWAIPAAVSGGVINAATTPTLPGETNERAVNTGMIGGVLGEGVVRGAGRVIQPIIQTPAVQNLLNKQIVPTPGQAIGGWVKRLEEKIGSWPFVGDIIGNAQNRARNELGRSAINLEMPSGMKVTEPGNAGVQQADDLLSGGYKKLYGDTTVTRDAQLVQDLRHSVNTPAIPLSKEYRQMYDKIIGRDVLDRLKPGESFSSGQVKAEIEADLGKAIRKLGFKGQEGALRDALLSARQAVRDLAGRQAGIDQATRQALDRGYANVRAMESAAQRAESNAGVPTPLQIVNAARPNSALEQLGRDAQTVLGNRVPNSGTTDRALAALLLGGAGAAASSTKPYQETPYLNAFGPGYWLALGASPLLYSRPASQYMVGDLIPGQPALSAAMRQYAPYGAPAGAVLSNYGQ